MSIVGSSSGDAGKTSRSLWACFGSSRHFIHSLLRERQVSHLSLAQRGARHWTSTFAALRLPIQGLGEAAH